MNVEPYFDVTTTLNSLSTSFDDQATKLVYTLVSTLAIEDMRCKPRKNEIQHSVNGSVIEGLGVDEHLCSFRVYQTIDCWFDNESA